MRPAAKWSITKTSAEKYRWNTGRQDEGEAAMQKQLTMNITHPIISTHKSRVGLLEKKHRDLTGMTRAQAGQNISFAV